MPRGAAENLESGTYTIILEPRFNLQFIIVMTLIPSTPVFMVNGLLAVFSAIPDPYGLGFHFQFWPTYAIAAALFILLFILQCYKYSKGISKIVFYQAEAGRNSHSYRTEHRASQPRFEYYIWGKVTDSGIVTPESLKLSIRHYVNYHNSPKLLTDTGLILDLGQCEERTDRAPKASDRCVLHTASTRFAERGSPNWARERFQALRSYLNFPIEDQGLVEEVYTPDAKKLLAEQRKKQQDLENTRSGREERLSLEEPLDHHKDGLPIETGEPENTRDPETTEDAKSALARKLDENAAQAEHVEHTTNNPH